jgi:hypothetical protein
LVRSELTGTPLPESLVRRQNRNGFRLAARVLGVAAEEYRHVGLAVIADGDASGAEARELKKEKWVGCHVKFEPTSFSAFVQCANMSSDVFAAHYGRVARHITLFRSQENEEHFRLWCCIPFAPRVACVVSVSLSDSLLAQHVLDDEFFQFIW